MPLELSAFTATPSKCPLMKAIDKLPKEDRAVVLQALRSDVRQYPHNKIAAVLSETINEPITDNAVGRHRHGKCSCPKD